MIGFIKRFITLSVFTLPIVNGQVYEKIFDFEDERNRLYGTSFFLGSEVTSTLVQAQNEDIYGTASAGGNFGGGVIFRIKRDGKIQTIKEFEIDNNPLGGWNPQTGLTSANDGNLYGATIYGGENGKGTFFRVTPSGIFSELSSFPNDLRIASGGRLTLGPDGRLYGVSEGGGQYGIGAIFAIDLAGNFSTIYSFDPSGSTPPRQPVGNVTFGPNGEIFGITYSGGTNDLGTIFALNRNRSVEFVVILSGTEGQNRGSKPTHGLTLGQDGNLYGTTSSGGTHDKGTVFRISPDGIFESIVDFKGKNSLFPDERPAGELCAASDGRLYGVTSPGLSSNGRGTIFRVSTEGTFESLVDLNAISIPPWFQDPTTGLFQADDGRLYGASGNGGGCIFYYDINKNAVEVSQFIGGESGTPLGKIPLSVLEQDNRGGFFGTTSKSIMGQGSVFRISNSGAYETIAHLFSASENELAGSFSKGVLSCDDGYLYAVSEGGGGDAEGGAFIRINENGEWSVIRKFGSWETRFESGYGPSGELISDGEDAFLGLTWAGGENDHGTLYRVEKDGSIEFLIEFTGESGPFPGSYPRGRLLRDPQGNLFGTTLRGGSYNCGTIFKIDSAGIFSTLIEFTGQHEQSSGSGTISTIEGSGPGPGLCLTSSGGMYGVTSGGGIHGFGTMFRIDSGGNAETLAHFSGHGTGSNRGSDSVCEIIEGSDGCLFGTCYAGGIYGFGTIWKFDSNDGFQTVFDFPTEGNGYPEAGLAMGTDGNLYGTTSGGDGTVYRILVDGPPILSDSMFILEPGNNVVVSCKLNPRGVSTEVTLEVGFDGVSFSELSQIAINSNGWNTRRVGSRLPNLEDGVSYYFRFRGNSILGESHSESVKVSTLGLPLISNLSTSVVFNSGAGLFGYVDARDYETRVVFEYGNDGISFPFSAAASPFQVTGRDSKPVMVNLVNLTSGADYYFRIRATNAGGTAVSGTQSFRTLSEPVPQIGGSFALGTTSVRVEGLVDPEGSISSVVFEYDTAPNFPSPSSVSVAQGTQSGSGSRPVSAVLTNLAQGLTYHYRLRATSDGGVGVSEAATFSMNVLSGFTRVHPGAPPESEGFLTVNLLPSGLLHGWRFLGEQEWRASGVPATGLATGDREIEFRPVNGYLQPPAESVDVVSGAAATVLERVYYETEAGAGGTGGLSVTLKPDSLTSGPDRARWRLLGEDDNAWRDSGTTLSALLPGAYLIEHKPVPGRATPPNASVLVVAGQTAAPTVTYFLPDATAGAIPSVLAFETVTASGDGPYAHVGQLRSRAGSGTGFVVKPRVVATAAHVVWDDGTLSAAQGLQWMFQRHRGLHDPKPLQPRGFYLYDGYAAQRTLDNSPGDSSPESQSLDVAAIYFNEDAARGGYGGFLASDLAENEFLLSNANKMLVGYPLDGVAPASRGRMHATAPFNVPFSAAFGRTFTTTDLRSFGGNSGGPLCVQFEGGPYLPAAIYLGGNAQTVVRAIDSEVVELFNRAEVSGNGGGNNTGGGITHTGLTPIGGAGDPGALRVVIEPAGAINAGAGWRLRPETNYRNSGDQRSGLNAGRYTLELAQAGGFQLPTSQSVSIKGGQLTTLTFSYALLPVPASAITLRGNERSIGNGDASPSALDGSDFGLAAVDGGTATRSFTISNPGTAELSLGSIDLGGSHPDDFSLSIPPGASIPPGGSTTFTILFDPSASGTRSATVSFATNVTGSNPFSFAIQGNDTTDSDSDGFTDVEEAALAELLASFTVGQTVDLDLSFLRLASGQILALLNLPPGLSFDPGTYRITGTITGKAATPQVEIRKLAGADIVSSVTTDFPVFTPARLTVGGARPFPATRIGRRSKPQTLVVTNSGELALKEVVVRTTGRAAREFLVTQPATNTLGSNASTSFTITFKPRAKGNRSASVTIFSNTAPVSLPLSGKGR